MTEPKTAEEWGRLAVSLPGWRWMAGMQTGPRQEDVGPDGAICIDLWRIKSDGVLPNPDDPATAGCLLALLGGPVVVVGGDGRTTIAQVNSVHGRGANIGRACIAAAAALGRWPGGEG